MKADRQMRKWWLVAAMLLMALPALANDPRYPEWWYERGVISNNVHTTNNYALATQGQVKWLAKQARL